MCRTDLSEVRNRLLVCWTNVVDAYAIPVDKCWSAAVVGFEITYDRLAI